MERDSICGMWRDQVRRDPGALAVVDGGRRLDRRSLDLLAGALASRLTAGCRRVGVVMERSAEMVAALLGILGTGAAYVPAEPSLPAARVRTMMGDAEVDAMVVAPGLERLAEGRPCLVVGPGTEGTARPAPCRASGEDLAYVLFTSGSTGRPKGVAVRNRNVCHYVRAFAEEFRPGPGDVMLQCSVCSFDIFVEEVFGSLLNGAALAIPSPAERSGAASLMRFAGRAGVTIVSGFPYLLADLNRLPSLPPSVRLLISGGDVLRAAYVDRLLPQAEVYNTYGPSETTVCATYQRCNGVEPLPDGTYPVGRPVRGATVELLDERLRPVPAGEVGEICISGGGVSAGYVAGTGRDERAFVQRGDGGVLYRSGDMGRALPDGSLAFLHRRDSQVMIGGRRVEPGEAESALASLPGVARAVVHAFEDSDGLPYLVGYVVAEDEAAPPGASALRRGMSRLLPDYMVPEFLVLVRELPLTDRGKVDARALPVVLKEGSHGL